MQGAKGFFTEITLKRSAVEVLTLGVIHVYTGGYGFEKERMHELKKYLDKQGIMCKYLQHKVHFEVTLVSVK